MADIKDISSVNEQVERMEQEESRRPEILRSFSQAELDEMEKKLVRKIDLRILPILIILFLLNILDRNAIANARLGGLEDTLGITDVQYQTAVMVLWGKCFHQRSATKLKERSKTDHGFSWLHFYDDVGISVRSIDSTSP
jgi:hypothetical protein